MPQLNIPSIGERYRLTRKWEFPLHLENRNTTLISKFKPDYKFQWAHEGSVLATLPKGTILRVDRIYIRKGKGEWDSITFYVGETPGDDKRPKDRKLQGSRFWAKLDDVNEIFCEPLGKNPKAK